MSGAVGGDPAVDLPPLGVVGFTVGGWVDDSGGDDDEAELRRRRTVTVAHPVSQPDCLSACLRPVNQSPSQPASQPAGMGS